MKTSMTLGKRIAFGIIVMLGLLVIVGTAGYYGLNRVLSVMELNSSMRNFQMITSLIKEQTDQYQLNAYNGEIELANTARQGAILQIDKGVELIQKIKIHPAMSQAGKKSLSAAEAEVLNYKKDFIELINAIEQRNQLGIEIKKSYEMFLEEVKGQFLAEDIENGSSIFISSFIAYDTQTSKGNWTALSNAVAALEKNIATWHQKIKNSDELSAISNKLRALYEQMKAAIESYQTQVANQHNFRESMKARKSNLYDANKNLGEISSQQLQTEINVSLNIMLGVLIVGLLFGTFYAIVSTRSIVNKIKSISRGVSGGAEQVKLYAGQLSFASHSLAEGATEQAASLEETSASLEEMSTMTKLNADNSHQADNLMKEVHQIVGEADRSMASLTNSIQDISVASEETSKIIKTIDEIAFQTNLLALNAAVEAARAGEAGAGFAVVADEVRNLALRAAEAAQNTADLIEGTVKKVDEGSVLVTQTNTAFSNVTTSIGKVGNLVGEITTASREQSLGIEQLNRAVGEMDKVVQQNAANSEESASSAEEMKAQAEQLSRIVDDLEVLVEGNKQARNTSASELETNRGNEYQALICDS